MATPVKARPGNQGHFMGDSMHFYRMAIICDMLECLLAGREWSHVGEGVMPLSVFCSAGPVEENQTS